MTSLLRELNEIIVDMCRSQDLMRICQVNKEFLNICILRPIKNLKQSIIAEDIYSLVRLKNNKKFLNTSQLRNYAIELLLEHPNPKIMMFLIQHCKSVIRSGGMYKIYSNQLLSKKHHKMASKFVDYTVKNQGRGGMRQSALLYNSTLDSIPIDNNFSQYDLSIVCATNCVRTISAMINVPHYRIEIFKSIEQLLVISSYYNNIEMICILLISAKLHYLPIIISEYVKRAIVVCMACSRNVILNILEVWCPREDAISEINFEDAQYYHDYRLIMQIATCHQEINLLNVIPILIYKDDCEFLEIYIKTLLDTNEGDYFIDFICELLVLAINHNKTKTSQFLIGFIDICSKGTPSRLREYLQDMLNKLHKNFNLDILESIIHLTIDFPINKKYIETIDKIKKISYII